MLLERSFRRRAGVLNRPSPLVILGGEEELWSMLRRFSTYPMAEPGETIKTVIPNHFDAGNSAWLQKEIQEIWSRHWFVRLMAWLERRLPPLPALLRRAFRLFGVEIVRTIPAPGALLYGFAVGDRRRIFERVLFYRSDKALPLASEVIAAVKVEARLTFANFEHDKKVQRLFGWLERYARRVDDQLVRKGRLDLNGRRSDETRGVRSVSVRNILYLGVMLEACRPGRISLRGYRKALDRLAEVLDSSSVAIHASLAGFAEALPVGHLAAPEDLTLPDGSRVHSDRIEGQWGLKTIRHGGPLDRVQVVSPTTGQPAAPEAVPDAVEAIARAEQLLIVPENLLSDLAAYLSSPGVARALVGAQEAGKTRAGMSSERRRSRWRKPTRHAARRSRGEAVGLAPPAGPPPPRQAPSSRGRGPRTPRRGGTGPRSAASAADRRPAPAPAGTRPTRLRRAALPRGLPAARHGRRARRAPC
jgi:hypothetical protein